MTIRNLNTAENFINDVDSHTIVFEFEEFMFVDGLLHDEIKIFGIIDVVREEIVQLDLMTYYETLALALTLEKQDEDKREFFKSVLLEMIENYFDQANGQDTAPLEYMFELVEMMKSKEGLAMTEPQKVVVSFGDFILEGFDKTKLLNMSIDEVKNAVGSAYKDVAKGHFEVSDLQQKGMAEDVVIYLAYKLSQQEVH